MLMQDGLNIVRTAKRIVDEKNRDEIAQEFLFQTRSIETVRLLSFAYRRAPSRTVAYRRVDRAHWNWD